jgi:putative selenium metabolism protein SsnA
MLITHGRLATMTMPNVVMEDGAILVRDGAIADLGPTRDLLQRWPNEQADCIDAQGKLVLPGNICAHTHFYGALARGMAIPGEPPRNFIEILQKLWWRLDLALDHEAVRLSAQVCLADAIRHGTTMLIDHHASPNVIDGSLGVIAQAAVAAGVRVALCYEVTDRNGLEGARAGIAENLRFARTIDTRRHPTLRAAMGVHASFTVGDATLESCVRAASEAGIPIHLHVAEDRYDQQDALSQYGVRVVERLASRGALTERTLCAHCVHVDQREMDLLAGSGAKVIHQPRSNMNNGVGVAPILALLEREACVGLGNDGFSNDAFSEMKVADFLQKLYFGDPRALGADRITNIAYANNARVARLFWPGTSCSLVVGSPADIILLDYQPFTPLTASNLPWHLLFGVDGGMVTHTICAGRVLMRDRQLLTLDEQEICARARHAAAATWARVTA